MDLNLTWLVPLKLISLIKLEVVKPTNLESYYYALDFCVVSIVCSKLLDRYVIPSCHTRIDRFAFKTAMWSSTTSKQCRIGLSDAWLHLAQVVLYWLDLAWLTDSKQ